MTTRGSHKICVQNSAGKGPRIFHTSDVYFIYPVAQCLKVKIFCTGNKNMELFLLKWVWSVYSNVQDQSLVWLLRCGEADAFAHPRTLSSVTSYCWVSDREAISEVWDRTPNLPAYIWFISIFQLNKIKTNTMFGLKPLIINDCLLPGGVWLAAVQ